jgi:hypothetical protein
MPPGVRTVLIVKLPQERPRRDFIENERRVPNRRVCAVMPLCFPDESAYSIQPRASHTCRRDFPIFVYSRLTIFAHDSPHDVNLEIGGSETLCKSAYLLLVCSSKSVERASSDDSGHEGAIRTGEASYNVFTHHVFLSLLPSEAIRESSTLSLTWKVATTVDLRKASIVNHGSLPVWIHTVNTGVCLWPSRS